MAHPVIWTVGLAAVGLIAAGVWLNRPAPEPPPDRPVSPAPAVEARPQPASEPAPEPEPALPRAEAAELAPRPDPVPDAVPAPAGTAGLPPKPDTPPAPANPRDAPTDPAPDPGGDPEDQATAEPVEPTILGRDAWRIYSAGSVLDPVNMGLLSRERREAVVEALRLGPPEPHFGAAAADADGRTVVVRAGMADLDTAEAAALADCIAQAHHCALVARILPEDWDNRRTGTLSPAQALIWANAVAAADAGGRVLFGWSPRGAADFAVVAEGDEAAAIRTVAQSCAALVPDAGQVPTSCALAWIDASAAASPAPEPEPEPHSPGPAAEPGDEAAARPVEPVALSPGHFHAYGPDSRLELLDATHLLPERRAFVVAGLEVAPPAPHFGAVAVAALGGTVVARTGMVDLETAEAAALRDCRSRATVCELIARVLPQDWDGRRTGTLSQAQSPVWARALDAAAAGDRVLFGWSPDGAAEFAIVTGGDEAATIRAVARACAGQSAAEEPGPCSLGWIDPPQPGSEPEPAGTPEPEPEPAALPAGEPGRYRGEADLRPAEGSGLGPASLNIAMIEARMALGGRPFFGALAVSTGPGARETGAASGFASLAQAEAEALARCGRRSDSCVVAVHLVPRDFDGRRTHTLTLPQAAEWSVYAALTRQDAGGGQHAVFAISPDGGVGTASARLPDLAERQAMARCRSHRQRLSLPEPVLSDSGICRVIARHGPAPHAAHPALPEPLADEPRTALPRTYRGAGLLRAVREARLGPADERMAMTSARQMLGGQPYFGALAVPVGAGTGLRTGAWGHASLASAEAEALALCRRRQWRDTCVIAVHLLPQDFDDRRDHTLTQLQGIAWAAYQTLTRQDGRHAAFAISNDGGAGSGIAASAEQAEARALDDCAAHRQRLALREPALPESGTCRVIARHDPALPAAAVAEPEPEPGVAAEPEPAAEAAPDPAPAPRAGDLRVYRGAEVWQRADLPADWSAAIDRAIEAGDRVPGGARHFGAIATPRDGSDGLFLALGFAGVDAAEAGALARCARVAGDCLILALRLPDDWDGSRDGTLGARQIPAWDVFVNSTNALPHRTLAASPDGAAGVGHGMSPDTADAEALRACRFDAERLIRPAGVSPGRCRIVARHQN